MNLCPTEMDIKFKHMLYEKHQYYLNRKKKIKLWNKLYFVEYKTEITQCVPLSAVSLLSKYIKQICRNVFLCTLHMHLFKRWIIHYAIIFKPFAKLRKANISFVMSIRPSVRIKQLGSHWTDFDKTWYLRLFRECVEIIHVTFKSDKNSGYFTGRRFYIYDNISLISS